MKCKCLMLLMVPVLLLLSCKKEKETTDHLPPPPVDTTTAPVLLKEITIPLVPSPYYHFEYNAAGKVVFASFASDLVRYDVFYNGDRISEMRNNIVNNKDRLQYTYDNNGRVLFIQYTDSAGVFFAESFFTYNGDKLVKIERFHTQGQGTVIDRVMTMTYGADDNLAELTIHQPSVNGSAALTTVDRFEQYDTKINVDGFSLLHPDIFEHFFLLPGVKIQKNNPGKLTRSGDGANYTIEYTYTYDSKNLPLIKTGEFLFLNGPNAGQRFTETTMYTYY